MVCVEGVVVQGNKFPRMRGGRRTPLIKLLPLLGLGVLLGPVLFCGGCGQQDRFVVQPPPDGLWTEQQDWVSMTRVRLPVPSWDLYPPLLALESGESLLPMVKGAVFRLGEDHLANLVWPDPEGRVSGLARKQDGSVWAVDRTGFLCRLVDDAWVAEGGQQQFSGVSGLLVDSRDRLFLYGADGLLAQRDQDGWTVWDPPSGMDFTAHYGHPDQGDFLVNNGLELYRLQEESLVLVVDLSDEDLLTNSRPRVHGDGHDQLVINMSSRWGYYFDGVMWRVLLADDYDLLRCFFHQGVLHAIGRRSFLSLIRFEDGQWTEVAPLPDEIYASSVAAMARAEQGFLIVLSDGSVLQMDENGGITRVLPELGDACALAEYQGRLHLMFTQGWHLAGNEEGWEIIGRPLGSYEYLFGVSLHLDGSGDLLVVGEENIQAYDGDGYRTLATSGNSGWNQGWALSNGRLALFDGREIQIFGHGRFHEDFILPPTFGEPRAVELDDEGQLWLSDGEHLGFWNDHVFHNDLNLLGWIVVILVQVEGGPLICGGEDVILSRTPGLGWSDISPHYPDYGSHDQIAAVASLRDGPGAVLVWETRERNLLRFDGETWVNQPRTDFGSRYGRTAMRRGESAVYVISGNNEYLRVTQGVSP